MKDDIEEKVTTKEAARIIGLHWQTLVKWRDENKKIRNGKKPYPDLKLMKAGRKFLYYKKALMAYIRKNTTGEDFT